MTGTSGSLSPRRLLVNTSLAHFVNDGTTFFVPVAAALLTTKRGIDPLEIAVLFALYYTSSATLSLYAGRWADRTGGPLRLIGVGMGLFAAGLLGFYISLSIGSPGEAYPIALASGFLSGFGSSFYHPLGATVLQKGIEPSRQGRALGLNGAMGSLGRALYPVLFFLFGLVVASNNSILLFTALAGAVGVLLWNATRPLPSSETRHLAVGVPQRKREALTRGIVSLTTVAFLRSVASQGVVAWIPSLLLVRYGSASAVSLRVAILYSAGIVGQPLFGLLTERFDRRALLGISAAGAAVCTLGFLLTSGLFELGLLFGLGLFTFSAFPLLSSLSHGYVGEHSTSLANGLVFGLGFAGGGAVGPLVVGLLANGSYRSLPGGFEVMVGLGLVSALATLALPRTGERGRMGLFG